MKGTHKPLNDWTLIKVWKNANLEPIKNKKRKSAQEKIDIIAQGRELGWVETARKHHISYPTLQNWRNLFASGGEPALAERLSMNNSEIKKRLHENQKLKESLAEKELKIRIKNEFLKIM